MKRDDRDITCEQDYTPLSNIELVAHIEQYARLMHNTPLNDGEWLDDIIDPARVLLARVEAAEAEAAEWRAAYADNELYGLALMQRRDELEAEASRLRIEFAAANLDVEELTYRVAELEAALDAQQWQPGHTEPPAHDWYWVYDFADDDVPMRRFYGPAGWGVYGDEAVPDWYMPIPPLPPAPQETTP